MKKISRRKSLLLPAAAAASVLVPAEPKAWFFNPAMYISSPPPMMWYQAYNNTHMAVNIDGTGGVPTDGGPVGTWFDLSGNNFHMFAPGNANRAVWRNGVGLNVNGATSLTTSGLAPNFNSRAASGGFYCDVVGSNKTWFFDFARVIFTTPGPLILRADPSGLSFFDGVSSFFSLSPPNTPTRGRQCVVTWRSTAIGITVRINGIEFAGSTPALAFTGTQSLVFGESTSETGIMRHYEFLVFNRDIGETNMLALEAYLIAKARAATGITVDETRTVMTIGDSLSQGINSTLVKTVYDIQFISNRPNWLWFEWNATGAALFSPYTNPTQVDAVRGANGSVISIWIGTNDINAFGRTGAQLLTDLTNYCNARRSAGWQKIIVCTLQACGAGSTVNPTEVGNFNTALRSGFSGFADALVDIAAAPHMNDPTNTTYYSTDQIHLTDAGYGILGPLFQTAFASV